jgi:hypothetical protein
MGTQYRIWAFTKIFVFKVCIPRRTRGLSPLLHALLIFRFVHSKQEAMMPYPYNFPLLSLPLMAPVQAMNHIVHNDSLLTLEALCQISVINRTADQPLVPVEGSCFMVPEQPVNWYGTDGTIALFQNGV